MTNRNIQGFGDDSLSVRESHHCRAEYADSFLPISTSTAARMGDFKETCRDAEPDFYIHVAEKKYVPHTDEELTRQQ